MNRCDNCGGKYIGYGHNGSPLVDGFVCDSCQVKVTTMRFENIKRRIKEKENETSIDVTTY